MEEQTMAQEVRRYDDLDGTPDAETLYFTLNGKPYEIDLSQENSEAFMAMLKPYLSKARPSNAAGGVIVYLPAPLSQATGLLTLLDSSMHAYSAGAAAPNLGGPFTSGQDAPSDRPSLKLASTPAARPTATPAPNQASEPHEPEAAAEQQAADPAGIPDKQVREWATRWGVPGVPARGRMPGAIRDVYNAFHDGDQKPWEELLQEHGIDPAKAAAQARALTAVDSKDKPVPTQDELNRQAAKRVGRLTPAQQSRLRLMYEAPDGRATSDGSSGDKASFDALRDRGCCTVVKTQRKKTTYQITEVGRVWFDVRGVSPSKT